MFGLTTVSFPLKYVLRYKSVLLRWIHHFKIGLNLEYGPCVYFRVEANRDVVIINPQNYYFNSKQFDIKWKFRKIKSCFIYLIITNFKTNHVKDVLLFMYSNLITCNNLSDKWHIYNVSISKWHVLVGMYIHFLMNVLFIQYKFLLLLRCFAINE